MDFQNFLNKVPKLKKIALPGEEAHQKLAPILRIQELENLDIELQNPSDAGVMALFYPNEEGITHFVLILRKTYQGVHSNQIGFPGGRAEDEDENLQETALRETEEEVGIPKSDIKVLRKLTKLYIPPSNFWVHPYIGFMEKTPVMVPQESEIEEILEIDLEHFLNGKNLVEKELSTFYAKNIQVPAFVLNGHTVWGATGMMLNEIKEMLTKIF